MDDIQSLDGFIDKEEFLQEEAEPQDGMSLRTILAMTCALGG